ncbi:MAG: hypothetical protein LBR97_02765 [Dysgonamonadaceae bacterium]|nr:hypothetical protein [Dysgonamonadaceae bacterium]
MKLRISMALSLLMLLCCSCFQKQHNEYSNNKSKKMIYVNDSKIPSLDTVNMKNLIDLLGKTLDSLPDIAGYKKEKIIIEDEEGQVEWDGVKYFEGNDLIFIVESNWVNRNIVYRITLYSDQIQEGELYIGQLIGNVKNLIKDKVPTSPDGELLVKSNKYPEIAIQLDISNIPLSSPLCYGTNTLSEIPDSIRIESIIIMKQ